MFCWFKIAIKKIDFWAMMATNVVHVRRSLDFGTENFKIVEVTYTLWLKKMY